MRINRVWAMPSKWTFECKPIKELVDRYVGNGKGWIDPFAGKHSPAEFTNDLNPDMPAKQHLEAVDFAEGLVMGYRRDYRGCIFDPPYSLTQVSRSYRDMGLKFEGKENPTGGFPKAKDYITQLLRPGNIVLYFGWNTVGFGKKRGFEIVEILIVCHGGNRNDTLVTVERKVATQDKAKASTRNEG